jgi:type III pantothenate kinase
MRRGLLQNTQQVRVDRPLQGFETTPGKSTAEAVDHGINLVFEAFCGHVVQSCPGRLLVTGGDGRLFVERSGAGEYRSDLVLDGLALALP